MLRARLLSGFYATLVGVIALAAPARAQRAEPVATVFDVPLPGGLPGALAAIDDRVSPDRSQFLLELIRRTYDTPIVAVNDPRTALVRSLVDRLEVSSRNGGAGSSSDTLPLPLPPAIWTEAVFGGRATPQTLVSAIVQSRGAALLYCGLLALDDDTRAWLADNPDLVAEVALRHSGAFLVVSPGLRITGGAVRLPGGEAAEPIWRAFTGHPASDPSGFVRALLAQDEGRFAYFFRSMAQMTLVQVRLAFDLDSPDITARVAAARRLYSVFERAAAGWKVETRAFWRPELDPALLVGDLRADDAGRPLIPGTRAFWSAAFEDAGRGVRDLRALTGGDPANIVSLCEQVFDGDRLELRRRYDAALFASRVVARVTPENVQDALDVVRAALAYPTLVATLERARLDDLSAYARAARRATVISAIGDDVRGSRALAQFQGALAFVTRATLRGSLAKGSLPGLVSSLAAVELSERGDYDGRLARWFGEHVLDARGRAAGSPASEDSGGPDDNVPGPIDDDFVVLLAGPAAAQPRFVDWEGMRYRLDFRSAEATRLAAHLGDRRRPYLSTAQALVDVADALCDKGLTRDVLRREAAAIDRIGQRGPWFETEEGDPSRASGRLRDVTSALKRIARDGDVGGASRLAPALRESADDLMARGLLELAYAAALGEPDRASISAGDAASRHDFGLRLSGGRRSVAWRAPVAGADAGRSWHVTGSLLGLDVSLAEFALVPLSSRLPPRRPTLNEEDRRVFAQAAVLIEPGTLDDGAREVIVAAVQKGRTKLAAARTPAEITALADKVPLGPARRTLLPWLAAHQPERTAAFLSPAELFWLGLDSKPVDGVMNAWGAAAGPRLGCLCLQMIDRRPWEDREGRWHAGLLASGFPDLNLRLSELLSDLDMPAALLAPVLASATLDLVNTAISRDQDDRRGLVEFVQALRIERVEEYLALLTADGPLVPVGDAGKSAHAGVSR